LDLGSPVTLVIYINALYSFPQIAEAVFARVISSQKEDRVEASKLLAGPAVDPFSGVKNHFSGFTLVGDRQSFLNDLRDSIYAAKIVSYTQGYLLLRQAASDYNWKLNYGGIALMWRGGCIIRYLRETPLLIVKGQNSWER
jgi:6-phosphogluconate dehydrogenase